MSALSGQGCTHHGPLRAYTTICWPGCAPETRPATVSTRSRPPCAAGGILVKAIAGFTGAFCVRQPLDSMAIAAKTTICHKLKCEAIRVGGFMSDSRAFVQILARNPARYNACKCAALAHKFPSRTFTLFPREQPHQHRCPRKIHSPKPCAVR